VPGVLMSAKALEIVLPPLPQAAGVLAYAGAGTR
jgi:hypothetical protein